MGVCGEDEEQRRGLDGRALKLGRGLGVRWRQAWKWDDDGRGLEVGRRWTLFGSGGSSQRKSWSGSGSRGSSNETLAEDHLLFVDEFLI